VSPGIYQVNVVVPSVPPATYPFEIEAEGYTSPQGVLLVIGR